MGTNFYWSSTNTPSELGSLDYEDRDDLSVHIGKRSAAGLWCWDCGVTLDKRGVDGVHKGHPTARPDIHGFREYAEAMRELKYDSCPLCGARPLPDSHNAAMVELGFEKAADQRPRGVAGCSFFTWAQSPETVGALCRKYAGEEIIEDEYGRALTGDAFRLMLECNCPIKFSNSIGRWFC